MKVILDVVKAHKRGAPVGIYSVCSAHPLVLEAALLHARSTGCHALIEATSNQVNQDGGYTGMVPQDFCNRVYAIADKVGFAREDVLFGGDHLGPNCWQDLPPDQAMEKSKVLIDQYIRAGFRKIHLDCSMSCLGDETPLSDNTVAERAATLSAVAESAWEQAGGEPPVYIIGTEVPVPGGAHETLDTLAVTTPEAAATTIVIHQQAFETAGLSDAWSRVVALVVQPGVEFDHHQVFDYDSGAAQSLSCFIESNENLIYEAHSTDYQPPDCYRALVQDHFAILKVGPALTYAMREALWALDHIEREWLGESRASQLRQTLTQTMKDDPVYWQKYYHGDDAQILLDCQYSLSDRIRYYWPRQEVQEALDTLVNNLGANPPPMTLLSQYLPAQYWAIRNGVISNTVNEIVIHYICSVLQSYSDACNGQRKQ